MQSYWVNDIPAAPDVIDLDLPDEFDLGPFPAVEAILINPLGDEVSVSGMTFLLDADERTVTVAWGIPTRFAVAGIYQLQLILVGFGQIIRRLDPEPFVVEENTGWHTLSSARRQWADAPFDHAILFELLDVAGGQCLTYAPALAADALVPADYRKAQILQARNIWNAGKKDENDGIGGEGFVIRTFPMDWTVKNLLRPKRGVPVVG